MSRKRKRQDDDIAGPATKRRTQPKYVPQTGGGYARTSPTAEFKYKDTSWLADNFPSGRVFGNGHSGGGPQITKIGRGTASSERVGKQIHVHQLFFKWKLEKKPHNLREKCGVSARIIVFQDKQNNGTPISSADSVITRYSADSDDPLIAPIYSTLCFRELTETERYRIWHDEIFDMNDLLGAQKDDLDDFGLSSHTAECFLTFKKPIKLEYKGSSGVAGELRSNNFGFIIVYDDPDVDMSVRYIARMKYTDY